MNQLCFLCNKEIKNYKKNDKKITICPHCTIRLCNNLPRRSRESLEILKAAIELFKISNMIKPSKVSNMYNNYLKSLKNF